MNVHQDCMTANALADAVDRVAEHLSKLGASGRAHREVIAALADGPAMFEDLVRETALPRRVVEQLPTLLGDDLQADGAKLMLRPGRSADYRKRFDLEQLQDSALTDPPARRLRQSGALVTLMTSIIASGPKPVQALDHVPATPETTIRRALWMDGVFDLAGSTVLYIGDHDLTSIAACLVNRDVRGIVVDVDENLLEFIDREAATRGLAIRTAYADFRLGLPTVARQSADLVFTDPPYTPEGVRLFLARGLEGLRDRANGRLLMAYGFGSHQPTLGLKVQEAVLSLSIVCEAILPHFNRYAGAQAVGSASDLYVCRPTSMTWKSLDRATHEAINIYTHGSQSLEGVSPSHTATLSNALHQAAAGPEQMTVGALVALARPRPQPPMVGLSLSEVLDGSAQSLIKGARASAVAVDLIGDTGSWLFRTLLGLNVQRVALAVRNNHRSIGSQSAQEDLRQLVGSKWSLRFRRSTPDSQHAIIEATEISATELAGADIAKRFLLDGAHRKLGNSWREALVKASRRMETEAISKNEARSMVTAAMLPEHILDITLIELPEHQIRHVLNTVGSQMAQLASTRLN